MNSNYAAVCVFSINNHYVDISFWNTVSKIIFWSSYLLIGLPGNYFYDYEMYPYDFYSPGPNYRPNYRNYGGRGDYGGYGGYDFYPSRNFPRGGGGGGGRPYRGGNNRF